MSTGQKQRVKLAAALAHDPHLILLDEPTDGLDPVQRDDMLTLIRRVGTEYGIDVLLSSHLLDEVERVCDAAVILGDGRVLASGPLAELRASVGGWEVEVEQRPREQLAAALAAAGATGDHGRRCGCASRTSTSADPVRDAVADLGLALVRLERRRLSLEDVFLEPASTATSPARRRASCDEPTPASSTAGYRPYDGPRLGRAGAIRSLVRSTAQRVMGIGGRARTKVLPFAAAVIAFVPAHRVHRRRRARSTTSGSGATSSRRTASTTASSCRPSSCSPPFVAPEALCPDRRTGLLGLYLASPLTRTSYLAVEGGAR